MPVVPTEQVVLPDLAVVLERNHVLQGTDHAEGALDHAPDRHESVAGQGELAVRLGYSVVAEQRGPQVVRQRHTQLVRHGADGGGIGRRT
jgi:hypothetical protein